MEPAALAGGSLCAVLSLSVMSNSLRPHGLQPARLLCPCEFSRQEYESGLPCPPPGNLPNPGMEPKTPTLHVDSLQSEPPGKPKNTGVSSLSPLQRVFWTQESNQGLLHCRWIILPTELLGKSFSIESMQHICNIYAFFLKLHKLFKT